MLDNLARIKKPPLISAHKIDLEVVRQIRDTDLLHVSVVIADGEGGRGHNNPKKDLARIDDLGTITKPAAVST